MAEVMLERDGGRIACRRPRASAASPSALLFSDFLEPIEDTVARFQQIASQGVRGHLVQILDPAEETLPYSAAPSSRRPKAATG